MSALKFFLVWQQFNIRTQDYTDHVIMSNDGDFGWDSFHEV